VATPQITTLIESKDRFEILGLEIAAILLLEMRGQMTLAASAGKDPSAWHFRVFHERAEPWSEFIERPEPQSEPLDCSPIVNVWFDRSKYDPKGSNVVSRQKYASTYNLDCYGYGIAKGTLGGHQPSDQSASLEAHRAMRLVRNILMASHYTYLGQRADVWTRVVDTRQVFQPQIDGKSVQNIVGARLELVVEHTEYSPQYQGEPLELVSAGVTRASNGQLIAEFQKDFTAPAT
jgi:hypothetical protein